MKEYTGAMVQAYVRKIEKELTTESYSHNHVNNLFDDYNKWVTVHCAVTNMCSMIQQDIYNID